MRWALAFMLCACGARTGLSSSPSLHDAGVEESTPPPPPPPPPKPCFAVEYPTGDFRNIPFALSDTHVYFMSDDFHLVRVPKEGGAPEAIQAFGNDWPSGRILVDATSLYWVNDKGTIYRGANAGGTSDIIGNMPNPSFSYGAMAVNDTALLVLMDPGSFGQLSKNGGDVAPIAPPKAPTGPVLDAYADDERVYWMTSEHVFAFGLAPPYPLTSYGGYPTGLAVDDGDVYWTADADVVHFAKKGDASQAGELEGHARGPIAVGKDAVFGAGPSGIVKAAKAGGPSTLVVPGYIPTKIATDATCVYYSTKNGTLARFPQSQ